MPPRHLLPTRNVRWLVLGLVACGPGSSARADDPASAFFARHCQGWHAGDKPKGDFRLDGLSFDFRDRSNRERWLTVLEQLQSGAMPPKGKPRPPAGDVRALADWI